MFALDKLSSSEVLCRHSGVVNKCHLPSAQCSIIRQFPSIFLEAGLRLSTSKFMSSTFSNYVLPTCIDNNSLPKETF